MYENKWLRFSLKNPKISFLNSKNGRKICKNADFEKPLFEISNLSNGQTDRQTDRQTHTKVTTEGTLSGFQEFFLQPIIKDRPKNETTLFSISI